MPPSCLDRFYFAAETTSVTSTSRLRTRKAGSFASTPDAKPDNFKPLISPAATVAGSTTLIDEIRTAPP